MAACPSGEPPDCAAVTHAWVDGEAVDPQAQVAASGDGHFTTLQVRGGRAQGLALHRARLEHAHHAVFGLALDTPRVLGYLRRALAEHGAGDATVRVALVPAARGAGTAGEGVVITLGPAATPGTRPVRLKSFVHQRAFPELKHLGTFPQFQLRRAAVVHGCDDALFVDAAGLISEGSFWNIGFWCEGGVVWPEAPALRGTCERLLQAGLADAGIPQETRPVRLADLRGVNGAFAANSRGVWPVAAIDGWVIPVDPGHPPLLAAALASRPWDAI